MKFVNSITQFFSSFTKGKTNVKRASLFGPDYKQAVLIKLGREQFKALLNKGISVPVVLL